VDDGADGHGGQYAIGIAALDRSGRLAPQAPPGTAP
jgi:hypothetical protein